MRKTILTLCAWATLLVAHAQTFNFGYCNGEVSTSTTWGDMGVGNTSAAIFIPSSVLSGMAGNEITTIRVGLATRLNIDELSVWVRPSLDGDNLAEGKLNRKQKRVQQGWNEVNLNEAYTIENLADGLYVGYTYHHTSLSNAVSVVGSTPEGTAFFKKNDNTQWEDFSDKGAISIEAVVSGSSLPQYDLALNSVAIVPNLAEGMTAYQLKADVANVAASDIEGFTLTISGGGIDEVTHHVAQTVESGRQANVAFSFTASSVIDASQPISVSISSLDNATDENMANNTAEASFAAFQRNVLVEEFTTQRCPNCPRGAQEMNEALHSKDIYGERVSVVCHHSAFNTDNYTLPCDVDMLWLFNEGGSTYAPAWMINRQARYGQNTVQTGQKQAIYFISSPSDFAAELDMEMALPTHLMLGVTATLADGQVNVVVNGVRDNDFDLANPLLTVYLTEDNIDDRQDSSNGMIDHYQHNHVIRAYNNTWGDDIAWEGNIFSANYTFSMEDDWKKEDLKVVALVANYDAESNLNCAVENSASAAVSFEETGQTTSINPTAVVCNAIPSRSIYDLQGRLINKNSSTRQLVNSSTLKKGILIVKGADGTTRKVIVK